MSLNYSDSKILETTKLETPFGDVLVHRLDYELTKAFIPGFSDVESPEQYVAEFVSGSRKGLHIKQAPKGNEQSSFESALIALMDEYSRGIAKDIYRKYADDHFDYFA